MEALNYGTALLLRILPNSDSISASETPSTIGASDSRSGLGYHLPESPASATHPKIQTLPSEATPAYENYHRIYILEGQIRIRRFPTLFFLPPAPVPAYLVGDSF
ncbi:hypothetical protein LXL04_008113 [Taraxacum kok-saghyz]